MPRFPGFPERPHYNSVKLYLSELAKDIAEMVVDPVKMERFREQLKVYAKLWNEWKTAEEADQKGFWKPEMGRPECILNVFSTSYNPLKEPQKEAKRLAGSYALCALIHDSQLLHLDKINTDIIPTEAVEETLSAPRHMLEDRIVGSWNSGPDVREIYVIEVFFNRVNVDLRELCKSVENKSKLRSIEQEIQQANKLSNIEFLELTAEKFEERTKKILSKDETWHDLDRSLKGWFDSAIGRLEKLGFKNKAGLLKYFYKNLLHFAEGISIRSFRGFPDSSIASSARKNASELAEKFRDLAERAKENSTPEKPADTTKGGKGEKVKKDEQKVIIAFGEYESKRGNKVGISSTDLGREVQMTWSQLRPVLDRLGRKQLIEGHKGDGYTAYWLPVEFDENDPYKHQCNVNEFRLTQQGQKLYGKIAEKPAEIEQGDKDTKKEREGMIKVRKPWYKKAWIWCLGFLSFIVLLTTALLNLDTIIEKIKGETGKQTPSSKQFDEKPINEPGSETDKPILPKLAIKRLIEDFEIELQQYYNNFLRTYQKIEDDFIGGKSSRTPLDSTIFSDARLDIDKLTSGLERNIQNILLKEFSTEKFDTIETLSKEYTKYQLAINKVNSLKTEIAEMEHDPSRITSLFNRINRKK